MTCGAPGNRIDGRWASHRIGPRHAKPRSIGRVRGRCRIVGPGLDLNGRPELTADRTKEAREVGVASLQSVTETDTGITALFSVVLIEGWREEHLGLTLEHDTGGGRCDAQVTGSPHYPTTRTETFWPVGVWSNHSSTR